MNDDGLAPAHELQVDVDLILQIGLQINAEHDIDRLLTLTVQAIKESLKYSTCAIMLAEGTDLVIRAVTDYPEAIIGTRIPIGSGLTGRCASSREESLVPDLSKSPYYVHLGSEEFRSELDIPIVFRGKMLGVLNTQSAALNAFGEHDVHTLKILATQIGVALYNTRIRTQLELVQDIGVQLVTIVRAEELFPWIVRQIQQRLHHDSCAILRADGHDLVLEASTGGYAQDLVGMRIPFGDGITGRCALEQRVVNVGDVRSDRGYITSGVEGVRSEIASPILFEGKLHGVLTVESSAENAFDDDDTRLLSTLSAQVAVGLRQAQMFAEAERMAVTDALTGLYNYRYFYERLHAETARSARYGHPLSLVMIDLDFFKDVNDRFGHLKGDEVLREVARTVRRNIRRFDEPMAIRHADIDIASRYGGEEFIVIMPETGIEGAAIAAERLRAAIEAEVGHAAGLVGENGQTLNVTGSFGVAVFERGLGPEGLIKRADDAVYKAKHEGRNRVVVAQVSGAR
ncbi:MAG: sensor domain-containing diguanylate cyclase [Acidobacteria bacterium]|nr:sensor domain-containing diguanylate cyclase [Acidobacteriota bacterium]